jgi:uncharacterized protein
MIPFPRRKVLMTTSRGRKSPAVYNTEADAFPPSIVGVATATPAFIGYTEKAEINGEPVFLKPIRVASMADFENYFGGKFKPVYDIVEQKNPQNNNYDFSVEWQNSSSPSPTGSPSPGDRHDFYLEQAGTSEFNLYDGMRLFYANGGGNCYVVSVGAYDDGQQIKESDLLAGLNVIREQVGPTMLVIPDAVLLPADVSESEGEEPAEPPDYKPYRTSPAFQNVTRAMLAQCRDLQDRVAILDVYSTLSVVDQASLDKVINQFRVDVGDEALNYGMAYFPFLHTTLVGLSDYTYQNLNPLATLQSILRAEAINLYNDQPEKRTQVDKYINDMATKTTPEDVAQLNQNLSDAVPLFTDILRVVVEKNRILPPSAAMAGVYTFVDGTRGVWNAPANIDLNAIDRTTFKMNDTQQGDLNMPVDGKAVNAIREFVGRGSVVWGARTLDGNSNDYRYIQVRRTIIYIEQSIKNALAAFAFAPNTATTWVTVTAMVSNFLSNLWAQGGLMGEKASDAFTVQCGLGSTMTGMDILNGYMIVQVTLQMIHPAEFIELTFKQQMQDVG